MVRHGRESIGEVFTEGAEWCCHGRSRKALALGAAAVAPRRASCGGGRCPSMPSLTVGRWKRQPAQVLALLAHLGQPSILVT
jgi:hypothetical protein